MVQKLMLLLKFTLILFHDESMKNKITEDGEPLKMRNGEWRREEQEKWMGE